MSANKMCKRTQIGGEKMLKNLIGEMAKRNVTMNDLAVLLGIHRNSIANKVPVIRARSACVHLRSPRRVDK